MKIGIGIDTGGTCTDGVIYDMEEKKILAAAKTPTTKEDLSLGIGKVLDLLPGELLQKAEGIALSTTLATNACVENKGGRGKLIFLGARRGTIEELGGNYGLKADDTLIFIDCKETLQGEILEEPDWEETKGRLKEALRDCQAVGIVELFAEGTGAALEKKTREIVEELGIPAVCGYELFQEKNVIGRGAGALLNARLIFVIAEFLKAVKTALKERKMDIPLVIVRSDGSLMSEELSVKRPVETLLCGPVASVMGAAELHQVRDGVVIDMGGTTTDISLIRNGAPVRASGGITVGDWKIYVKGMYVDTFGLGGDTEVLLDQEGALSLGSRRIMPICMAGARFPQLRALLHQERQQKGKKNSWRKHIYVGLKEIGENKAYTAYERRIGAAFYQNPMNLAQLEEKFRITLVPHNLNRLVDEGVVIRCGITPTDAMHVLGDYNGYDTQASRDALAVMGELLELSEEALARLIYRKVEQRLYCNIGRILLWDKYPKLRKEGLNPGLEYLVEQIYEAAVKEREEADLGEAGRTYVSPGSDRSFMECRLYCEVPLIGVGGPIGVFLGEVAKLLHTRALIGAYSNVANALGAVVGNVEVCVTMEILPNPEGNNFRVTGGGESFFEEELEAARERAAETAKELARAEALRRGAAEEKLAFRLESVPVEATTSYGSNLFIMERVSAYASSGISLE